MSAFTRAMAWSIVRLRWPIVIAWIAAAIAVVVYLPSLQEAGDDTSLTGLVPDDAESLATGQRLAELSRDDRGEPAHRHPFELARAQWAV